MNGSMDGSSAVSVTLGLLMIVGNDISCMCVDVGHCDSVTVVALDTHHPPPSRQYSRWLFLSFSLSRQALWCCTTSPSLSSLPLGVAYCFSSTTTSSTTSTTVGASLSPSNNQSINHSINHLGEGFDATCLSLSDC